MNKNMKCVLILSYFSCLGAISGAFGAILAKAVMSRNKKHQD